MYKLKLKSKLKATLVKCLLCKKKRAFTVQGDNVGEGFKRAYCPGCDMGFETKYHYQPVRPEQ